MATIGSLPNESLFHMFEMMEAKDVSSSSVVCKLWQDVITKGEKNVWVKLFERTFECLPKTEKSVSYLCRYFHHREKLIRNIRQFCICSSNSRINSSNPRIAPLTFGDQKLLLLGSKSSGKLFSLRKASSNPKGSKVESLTKIPLKKFPSIENEVQPAFQRIGSFFKSNPSLSGKGRLKKINESILYSDNQHYAIFNSSLECEFANTKKNPFLIRRKDMVYYQEGSKLVGYDVVSSKSTGSMDILSDERVSSEFTVFIEPSFLLIPTKKGNLMFCDLTKRKVVYSKNLDVKFLDVKVKRKSLMILRENGAFELCDVCSGKTIKSFDGMPLNKEMPDWQRRINCGAEQFLFFDQGKNAFNICTIDTGELVFEQIFDEKIESVLISKGRLCIFLKDQQNRYSCLIQSLKTGKRIAQFEFPEEDVSKGYANISNQVLFISNPVEDEAKEESHYLHFIDLATGEKLTQREFLRNSSISQEEFHKGKLSFFSGVGNFQRIYYVEDFIPT